jgi:hypothetical protein
MAFTTTWSFGSGYDGWSFDDDNDVSPPCGTCAATRSHVSGAIRNSFFIADLPNVSTFANNHSPQINAAVVINDTIELDYGTPSDNDNTGADIIVTFTDETTEQSSAVFNSAGTLIHTITVNKTIDFITIRERRSNGPGGGEQSFTCDVLEVRLITASEITATAGKLRTPSAFIEDEGAGAAGGAGGGAGGNLADISADGLSIYIASFNNLGFPTLIKMSALLAADGSVVFDPGAGGRIGVQTGEQNAEIIWIAGNFGGTDVVEKSEDAGSSFTVKDNAAIGTVRTFQVGPSDDNRVLVFDGDNGDILETLDDGETWTTINAAVTPLINSLARLSTNLQEIVAGNEGDVTDSINYSPNSGVNLEDYQTGVYSNADATKVQVT